MPDEKETVVQSLSSLGIRKIADHPAADRFMEEHFAEADAMSDEELVRRWNAELVPLGFSPITMEDVV